MEENFDLFKQFLHELNSHELYDSLSDDDKERCEVYGNMVQALLDAVVNSTSEEDLVRILHFTTLSYTNRVFNKMKEMCKDDTDNYDKFFENIAETTVVLGVVNRPGY